MRTIMIMYFFYFLFLEVSRFFFKDHFPFFLRSANNVGDYSTACWASEQLQNFFNWGIKHYDFVSYFTCW